METIITTKTILLFMFAISNVVITSNAFSPNSIARTTCATSSSSSITTSSQSCLFRKALAAPVPVPVPGSSTLCMVNNDANKEDEEPIIQERTKEDHTMDSSSSSTTPIPTSTAMASMTKTAAQQDKNALLTVLLIAPPLIAKFGVVILVKIVTDIVVFPLLYMYRFCNIAKNKVVGLIVKPKQEIGIMKGDEINGMS